MPAEPLLAADQVREEGGGAQYTGQGASSPRAYDLPGSAGRSSGSRIAPVEHLNNTCLCGYAEQRLIEHKPDRSAENLADVPLSGIDPQIEGEPLKPQSFADLLAGMK